jgi:hypothetical protein
MRDLDALLSSLVNIDRNSLIAILSSETEAAKRLIDSARQRTFSQRANDARPWSVPLGSTGFCLSSSMAKYHRTCLRVTSFFADPLKISCVFGASRSQFAAVRVSANMAAIGPWSHAPRRAGRGSNRAFSPPRSNDPISPDAARHFADCFANRLQELHTVEPLASPQVRCSEPLIAGGRSHCQGEG